MIIPETEVVEHWEDIKKRFLDDKGDLKEEVKVKYIDDYGGLVLELDGIRLSIFGGTKVPEVEVL